MAENTSKQEAVRRAMSHFGNEAKPSQMKPWIKDRFGLEMSTDHISTAKGDILRKAGVKGKRPTKGAAKPAPKAAAPTQPAPSAPAGRKPAA